MIREGGELWDVIGAVFELHRGRRTLNPAWMATEGMKRIKFPPDLHPLGYVGCHLQLRQIARAFCRGNFDPTEINDQQNDLFPDTLQERYPARPAPGAEPEYVLLDQLTDDDIAYNVQRMRRASLALLRHGDALEAYGLARKNRVA